MTVVLDSACNQSLGSFTFVFHVQVTQYFFNYHCIEVFIQLYNHAYSSNK